MVVKNVYKGDFGYNLNFTLKDADGDAVNLTSATAITFTMVKKSDGTISKVAGTCTKNSPNTLGTCFYTVVDGDFDEVAEFEYQIKVTTASSVITCIPQETINVLRRF